ncbi:MASE4 domain-containing protein [Klebsiella pneumoniae]|nr:MASE4 domain-containing protein [Klebsiella pneumoniae]
MTAFFHTSFSSTSSILFPLLTSFLMVFHITIACFMGMKYWSSKRRLYLTPVSFGFACSALLMLGTLSSYPDWLTCNPAPVVNQNDAVIYYFFRNIMMAVLFMSSIILYYFRQRIMHSWKAHILTFTACILFTLTIIVLSWLYSSHSPWLSVNFIDDLSHTFTPLWQSIIGWLLMAVWFITLILLISLSKLRNIFWFSGAFFCSAYLFTLFQLLSTAGELDQTWYQARFFETLCTLFLILVLLVDVFILYRESNHKYVHSYQNSIRDPLTRLYNRSFFYDTLNQQLAKVNAQHPLSVLMFYVLGYFEETKLRHIRIGDPAQIILYSNQQTLKGHVASIGRAIVDQSVEQGTGLVANIKPNIPWVRLAQRVPVRIAFDTLPADVTLVSGTTCTVSIGGQ